MKICHLKIQITQNPKIKINNAQPKGVLKNDPVMC